MNFLEKQTQFYTDASAQLNKTTFEIHMIVDPKFRKRIEKQREIMKGINDTMKQLNTNVGLAGVSAKDFSEALKKEFSPVEFLHGNHGNVDFKKWESTEPYKKGQPLLVNGELCKII